MWVRHGDGGLRVSMGDGWAVVWACLGLFAVLRRMDLVHSEVVASTALREGATTKATDGDKPRGCTVSRSQALGLESRVTDGSMQPLSRRARGRSQPGRPGFGLVGFTWMMRGGKLLSVGPLDIPVQPNLSPAR